MADLSDLKIRFEVSGRENFYIESWAPEEFTVATSADYSRFLEKIQGLSKTLVGDGADQISDLTEGFNNAASTFAGRRFWKTEFDTQLFDKNAPFTCTLPFIFSAEADSIDANGNRVSGTLANVHRLAMLSKLTAPTKLDNGFQALPGPQIGGIDKGSFEYDEFSLSSLTDGIVRDAKAAYNTATRAKDMNRTFDPTVGTKVAFQVGNWFRIDEVVVKSVDAVAKSVIDRYQRKPSYAEASIQIESVYPPTTQDIEKWFMIETNRIF